MCVCVCILDTTIYEVCGVLRDVDAMSGKDLQLSIDVGVQLQAAEILRRGQLEPVALGSLQVQRALSKNIELQAHIALGDDLVLRDAKDRLVPPESGAVVLMDIHSGDAVCTNCGLVLAEKLPINYFY